MTEPFGPAPGDVWVVAARTSRLDDDLSRRATSWLDEEERARLRRFCFERDRSAYLLAHGLARWLLAKCQGIEPAHVQFERECHGKPIVVNDPELAFSLSHSHMAVLCTVGRGGRIGADIESTCRATAVDDSLFSYCTPAERRILAQLSTTAAKELFLLWWTIKEAIMKADGRGLGIHPTAICCANTFQATKSLMKIPALAGYTSYGDCHVGLVKAWNSH